VFANLGLAAPFLQYGTLCRKSLRELKIVHGTFQKNCAVLLGESYYKSGKGNGIFGIASSVEKYLSNSNFN